MKRLIGLCVVLAFIVLPTSIVTASEEEVHNVIVFHSYDSGLNWSGELQAGLEDALEGMNAELYVEYIDAYRTDSFKDEEGLFQYYKQRYSEVGADAVVIFDNVAYRFMESFYTELFDGVPMIFGGINSFTSEDIFYENSTGLSQTNRYKETIELIVSLHPDAATILAVGGSNPLAEKECQEIIESGQTHFSDLGFEVILSSTLEEQIEEISLYGDDTAVIPVGIIRDSNGRIYDSNEYSSALIDDTGAPVYSVLSAAINGGGAVGGYVVDGFEHGKAVGSYVTKVLQGDQAKDIPVLTESKSVYLFDHKRLDEFDIDGALLPQGAVIINVPERSLSISRIYVILYAGGAFFLIVIIIALLVNIRKRVSAESELQKQNEVLRHMAYHDPVTNLYNRKYLIDFLQNHMIKPEHEFTALYDVDIINLKMINDTYGHEIGSKIQKHIAGILKKTFRSERECVGVYQSEYLVVDSVVTSRDMAVQKARHLMSLLAKAIEIDYMEIDIKINIGIAIAPDHTMDSVQLVKKANIALVESIKVGPGQVKVFEDTLYRDILKRITLEKQLRRAISLDEFELYYQPKINLKTMKVNGCEALIRWNHPDGSVVYPGSFIPLAEEVGLIEDIGQWVVRQSATQVKQWNEQGYDIRISLNVSGREFDDDFIRNLKRVIDDVGVDPKLLEVEITETAALKDLEHSRSLVQTLFDIGLSVSLDDFGTGYSSMTYIKQLKASKLKIDKSFIDDLENYEQKVVVDSMIQLGKKLDYIVNVEGVETEEQLRILKYLGADEVQGWYFSKAVPAGTFIDYVNDFDQ